MIGASYRQLDHWCTKGVATSVQVAKGSGSQRRFHYRDLVRLRIIKSMRDAGVSLERIAAAFDRAEEIVGDDDVVPYITICGGEPAFVDHTGLTTLLSQPGQGMLGVLGVQGEITRLNETIRNVHPDAHVNPDGLDQQLLPFARPSDAGTGVADGEAPVDTPVEAGQLKLL